MWGGGASTFNGRTVLSQRRFRVTVVPAIALAVVLALSAVLFARVMAQPKAGLAPKFIVDAFWPKPLPNRWLLGQVSGVAVDGQDHVWIIQRPRSLTEDERGATLTPPRNECCIPAPPVMEFDNEGNLLSAWGGPGPGYDWPANEHGIYVDPQNNVWLAGNGEKDNQILKFTRDGRFIMQIGKPGMSRGDADTQNLNRPADTRVDPAANELYVADGYGNTGSSSSMPRPAPTSATGEPTAGHPAIRARRSSARRIAFASRWTGSSTCVTAATTASRRSTRTAPS
jgi:hypothetical protein